MQIIARNEVFEPMLGAPEGFSVHYNGNGLQMYFTFIQPQEHEITSIEQEEINLSFVVIDGLPIMSVKLGTQNWYDSPVALDDGAIIPTALKEDEGLILTMLLIDPLTGIIKGMRIAVLPHTFSVAFQKGIGTYGGIGIMETYRKSSEIYAKNSIKDILDHKDAVKGHIAASVASF